MALPILIFAVAFGAGFWAAVRFLPPLAEEAVGVFAGYAAAVLLGAALAAVGLVTYDMLKELQGVGASRFAGTKAMIVSDHIQSALYEGGFLAGLACIVYLLAPRAMRQRP